ncbi:MAG: chromosome segregation protein SMC [Gammaproteobacteria bacterium SG8_47]|nr:MAG: chromosome segregation protein SMC [Gammaproteobacteria bacterium SG8_47]
MRLSKIKLAGFKSFVDPTTISLPSNLIGIVGPNGCGKSNIIDAVRWVMGESSAKHLRGDSMADVIFNGSSSRKPVGQASIELVFDNSDGAVGGQYAEYAEIAVKRLVTRDGQSSYFLNSARCRRRDITDIFLGTGLGPRSYAIIEQGMISRLIEAKPEELRVFLEEAAGISKYKERRRETENRIRHTRENLDRINDLRDELTKQIERLQRQARTAERYKELRQQERLLSAQLQALRWRALDEQAHDTEGRLREEEIALESKVAEQRGVEAEIERQREQHVEATDGFNEVQSRYYSLGADVARLEQSIQHTRERRQQQNLDLAQLDQSIGEARAHLDTDQGRLSELNAVLADHQPALSSAESAEKIALAELSEADRAMHEWQQGWEAFNQRAAEVTRSAEVERTRIEHLEQHLVQLRERVERARAEIAGQSVTELQAQADEIHTRWQAQQADVGKLHETMQQQQRDIADQRERVTHLSAQLDEARSELQSHRGRFASLEALQQAALGKREGAVSEWLQGHALGDAARVAEGVEVEHGWERALECVLGLNLQAVCVDDLERACTDLGELEHGALALFETGATVRAAMDSTRTALLSKVNAPWSMDALLAGIYVADDLAQALSLRATLAPHESVVTADGLWVGPSWLRVVRDPDEHAGVLEREQEIRSLHAQIESLELRAGELEQQLSEARDALSARENAREHSQAELQRLGRDNAELQSQLSSKRAQLEHWAARRAALEGEIGELESQLSTENEDMSAARQRLQHALDAMQNCETERNGLIERRDECRARLDQARTSARSERDAAHAVALRVETLRTELASTQQGMARAQAQIDQLSARRAQLQSALAESEQPLQHMGDELERLLAQRMAVESELAAARSRVEDIDHRLRELEGERHSLDEDVQNRRNTLGEIRVGLQELRVRRQTFEERVAEVGFEIKALLEEMPAEANDEAWAQEVEAVERRISRLGPINLAAIEEYEQQSERKAYIDAQHADLTEALETLENAIRKIDRETRTRFKETFDKVNTGLQQTFPRLFGGGHAYLEMTGEDLLDAGVSVMARPPGKRNSTIHLLSGGEKALTAVAMVFSIFQLNPAPFCMLDEVDAPLDDANVGRFSEMVRDMAGVTQFIFITHNKVTMEVADHLTGVTMHEPGVSRLVAVDVDAAAQLAAM